MKKVLSLLVSFVFLQTQTWALSGGPVYGGGQLGISVIGTYAGVFVPETVNRIFSNPDVTPPSLASDANTLGLFVLGVPSEGVATGNYLFFQDGEAFFGTLTGLVDPASGELRALIAGAAVTNNATNGIEFLSPVSAVGRLDAQVEAVSGFTSSARLSGTAFIQLQGYVPDSSPNGFGFTTLREITFVVDGWKQSDIASSPTIPAPTTTTVPPPVVAP